MKAAVIVSPGSNCDRDVQVALRQSGGDNPVMHWHGDPGLPDVDLIVLAAPRQSHTLILQMAGRATRIAANKEHGHLLLPVRAMSAADDDGEGSLDAGSFDTALSVLQAMVELMAT